MSCFANRCDNRSEIRRTALGAPGKGKKNDKEDCVAPAACDCFMAEEMINNRNETVGLGSQTQKHLSHGQEQVCEATAEPVLRLLCKDFRGLERKGMCIHGFKCSKCNCKF